MSDGPRDDVVIRVDRLGKTYPVYRSPLDALKELIPGRKHHVDVPALEDVSFVVRRGERVGVVGANGAGKSTLLKVLAGTVDHTSGAFDVRGDLRAILELGTGFHEECSGRENILMGGLCLGYSARELERRTPWILDFSELHKVIDQPLRTYSTGMKMRLMYSVAFCGAVDTMIIDEALATGDGAFIRKCTNHIVELCGGGTTALIVSHNLYFLERICHRVIYLKDGRVVADGDPLQVCKLYEADLGRSFIEASDGSGAVSDFTRDEAAPEPQAPRAAPIITGGVATDERAFVDDKPLAADMLDPDGGPPGRAESNGTGEVVHADGSIEPIDFNGAPAVRHRQLVTLREARLFDAGGEPTSEIQVGQPCRLRFTLESRLRKRDVHVGFMIWNERNEHVATTTNVCSLDAGGSPNGLRLDLVEGLLELDVVFPSLRLGAGAYYLKFGVSPGNEHYSDDDLILSENRCLAFCVLRPDHVQTVFYEPHSVWSGLRRLGDLPAEAGALPATADPTPPPADASPTDDPAPTTDAATDPAAEDAPSLTAAAGALEVDRNP